MAAHRYWRVKITANNGAVDTNCAALALHTAVGGANVATGGTALADSFYSAGYEADKAFDGNAATFWNSTATAFPHHIGYDLGAGNEKDIVEFTFAVRNDGFTTAAPKDMQLEYSDDSSAWTAVLFIAGATGWTAGETRTYAIADPSSAYRYWRVYIDAVNVTTQNYTGISELEFRASVGGADQTSAGSAGTAAFAKDYYAPESLTPDKAFDDTSNSAASSWASNGTTAAGAGDYIGWDFGAGNEKAIAEVVLYMRNASGAGWDIQQAPWNWRLQYSTDKVAWSTKFNVQGGGGGFPDPATPVVINTDHSFPTGVSQRCWRIRATAVDGGGNVGLAEIRMYDGSGNLLSYSGGYSAASSQQEPGGPPLEAFDGIGPDTSLGSYWGGLGVAEWIGYAFAAAHAVVTVGIASRITYQNQSPKDFVVEYWDGSAWVAAMTLAGITGWTSGQWRYFNASGETTEPTAPAASRQPFIFTST